MTLRFIAGLWWVIVDVSPYRHATVNEVFEYAEEYQYE